MFWSIFFDLLKREIPYLFSTLLAWFGYYVASFIIVCLGLVLAGPDFWKGLTYALVGVRLDISVFQQTNLFFLLTTSTACLLMIYEKIKNS